MKKIKVFTSNDLDGAGSLLILKWMLGDKCEIEHSVSNIFHIKNDYNMYISDANGDECTKIFILNMIPEFEVDDRTMVFSKASEDSYRFKGKLGLSTTTTMLMDKFFSNTDKLSDERREVITAINEFYTDGVTSRTGVTVNALFAYANNKYTKFYERFNDGIGELSDKEMEIVKQYVGSFVKLFKGIEMVEHNKHEGMYMVLIPNMNHKHELLNKIFDKYEPSKMVFLVDAEGGLVSVRKNDSYDFDMGKLCDKLIVGRSLINCAGGRFTDKFIDFTKSFY